MCINKNESIHNILNTTSSNDGLKIKKYYWYQRKYPKGSKNYYWYQKKYPQKPIP